MPLFLALTAVIFWGSSLAAMRYLLRVTELTSVEIAASRLILTSLVLGMYLVFRKPKIPVKRDALKIIIASMIGIVYFNIANVAALKHLTGSQTALILNISPLIVAGLSAVFLKEHLSGKFMAGLIISLIGVTIVSLDKGEGFTVNQGVFWVLSAAFCQGVFFIFQKPLLNTYKPVELTFYFMSFAALILLPFTYQMAGKFSDIKILGAVLYLGIFASALPFVLWQAALSRSQASHLAQLLYLLVIPAAVFEWIFIGTVPTWTALSGGAITVAGVVFARWKKENSASRQAR